MSSSTRPADPVADSGEWETQTTRKQRKKQNKAKEEEEQSAAASSPAPAQPVAAAHDSEEHKGEDDGEVDFPVAPAPEAASSSSFPIDASGDAGEGADESGMEAEFLQSGCIGLDGKQIPPGTPLYQPPPPPPSATPARRPRFTINEAQLPKCFMCQTRHDIGQCKSSRREKI